MNGAEYIAEFLRQRGSEKVFTVTGGACAFILDAIGANPGMDYVCTQHEQAASMAADAVWRTVKKVGVSVATSGPGATNLLTGIACSYFDSIPQLAITGQVNKLESAAYLGAKVRQAGFQETDIVAMAKPITKYAVQVNNALELRRELTRAYNIAITGRMGPVLIDVPMNVQKEEAGEVVEYTPPETAKADAKTISATAKAIEQFLSNAERPLVLFGAGVGLSGAEKSTAAWLLKQNLPFVASWNGQGYFRHDMPNFMGQIGVYGDVGAQKLMRETDTLLVLGSRLDNRQRTGNVKNFASQARVLVLDIDEEELKKYAPDGYAAQALDLQFLPQVLESLVLPAVGNAWAARAGEVKREHYKKNVSVSAEKLGTLSPYDAIRKLNGFIADDAIVAADTGANLCWFMQMFHRTNQILFTDGGMSTMGYSLPAAIGAGLFAPGRQVICITGDGGLQMNIQELQTAIHYGVDVKIVLFNNKGYGIIRQFQDGNFHSRYEASGRGYSVPDFGKIALAYGFFYHKVETLEQLQGDIFNAKGPALIELVLHENTLVEPKQETSSRTHE